MDGATADHKRQIDLAASLTPGAGGRPSSYTVRGREPAAHVSLGALDQSYGFLLFPSRDAYERFADFALFADTEGPPDAIDLDSDHLCLELAPKSKLSRTMQKEISRHRWPVASPRAHPIVERRNRHAEILPLSEADLRIATACAAALSELIGSVGSTRTERGVGLALSSHAVTSLLASA